MSKENFIVAASGKIKRIKEQKSRSRIRGTLKKNIKTTFTHDGAEIDPEHRQMLERQFEDNKVAFEIKLEQERHKKHATQMRRINGSINRLEKQNKNFLKQMSTFRQDRISLTKVSQSNLRAISGLNSHK